MNIKINSPFLDGHPMSFCARTLRSSAARRHQLYRRRRAVVIAHVPQALPATGPARFRRGRLRVLQKYNVRFSGVI